MDRQLRSVLVIGSGPIVIGQAAEFDYSGSQACRALRQLGLRVILLNSNPATIMTDLAMADAVYLEPLTPEFAERVIARERPDGLLPTLGGQVGLNLAVALAEAGVLDRYGVRLLGTSLDAIRTAEDRELFKEAMARIGQPVPPSAPAHDLEEALRIAREIGYPVVVRPAFTLGGTGGGLARDEEELRAVAARGLRASPVRQVLIEKSVAGWKEIEFEVMRDADDTCISVCGMENLDPVGIHTGDSIVVAPIQTLPDRVVQRLRAAALTIIRALRIEGGCNVQFAVHPQTGQYYVIEVNPRVSRSSALASKATGYPIAKIAAQIAAGRRLAEIKNPITGNTYAAFEPVLDYVVVKIPRWPFDKFQLADRRLGTQMKATGEAMAIGRTFEEALLKAVRSLELGSLDPLRCLRDEPDEGIRRRLEQATDDRLFALFEAFRRGMGVEEVARLTAIDPWFLHKIAGLVAWEQRLAGRRLENLDAETLWAVKRAGLPDSHLAALLGCSEDDVRARRRELGVRPVYKTVDSCAAEFPAETPYYYSAYESEDEAPPSGRPSVLVLGSGPIRIGQGIEFDYCTVHAVWALQRAGYEAHIVNNNPETVSTDFDTADRLFFEPLTLEDVLHVIEAQRPVGVIPQFGGQTAINLAGPLAARGVRILGTPVEAIDTAEDRDKLDRLLARLGIPRPEGGAAGSVDEAVAIAERVGYPVLVRPSYVLGGRGMEVVHDAQELRDYAARAARVTPSHPLWVDAYVAGREVEVDAICDGHDVLIPGIMEHVERAGVHSGDSTAVYPPVSLSPQVKATLVEYTRRIALALGVVGLVNIQFVVTPADEVLVLEVNPRASRTVPFLSKVTGVPMVELAVRAMLGERLADMGYGTGLRPEPDFTAVKIAVFSWSKLTEVDVALGPEMKSTGEAIGIDVDYAQALRKAFLAAGQAVPPSGTLLCSIADRDKPEALPVLQGFARLGFRLLATAGTAAFLARHGLAVEPVRKVREGSPNLLDRIRAGEVHLVINTVSGGREPWQDGFVIRRTAVEHGVPCLTSLDTARALLTALAEGAGREPTVAPLDAYLERVRRAEVHRVAGA